MDSSSGVGGCIFAALALVFVAVLVIGCATYVDDWIDIQRVKADAALRQAEADRLWAEAEEQRAEAVTDVTGAARSRATAVNWLPFVPIIVVVVLLAPVLLAVARLSEN